MLVNEELDGKMVQEQATELRFDSLWPPTLTVEVFGLEGMDWGAS